MPTLYARRLFRVPRGTFRAPAEYNEGEVAMKDFASYTGGDFMREAQKAAAQFDGKDEGELIRTIYARAAEGRRAGTLTDEEIDAFCAQFAPMLDAGKRKKLYALAERLKKL